MTMYGLIVPVMQKMNICGSDPFLHSHELSHGLKWLGNNFEAFLTP
jgi:hypothetical protein